MSIQSIDILPLRQLAVGDRFVAVSDKKRKNRYRVTGLPVFNSGHGTSTRKCFNETTQAYESKSGNLKVIKLKGGAV